MNKTTTKFLNTAPCMWAAIADGNGQLRAADWQTIERDLNAISQQAAMLAEYLGHRLGTDGSGQHSHAAAVRRANRRLVKVRRAMGYSHPQNGALAF